ncbi:hypothetical protein EL26_17920 [Tumebacillus flagellatus]|uniref:Uncharacterized protein n=2 Tax=Tumebacillus flagellatus TaxID=1157490 RepID=A0A074LNF7_9BACL|nr:hypothetical protein EL26_17920 [Tumebacillus flagellatus]
MKSSFSVNVSLEEEGAEQVFKPQEVEVERIKTSAKDRPPTKFGITNGGKHQKSHSVAWSFFIDVVEKQAGSLADVLQYFYQSIAKVFYADELREGESASTVKNKNGQYVKTDYAYQMLINEMQHYNLQQLLTDSYTISQWNEILSHIVQTYVRAHQAARMASFNKKAKGRGEASALGKLNRVESILNDEETLDKLGEIVELFERVSIEEEMDTDPDEEAEEVQAEPEEDPSEDEAEELSEEDLNKLPPLDKAKHHIIAAAKKLIDFSAQSQKPDDLGNSLYLFREQLYKGFPTLAGQMGEQIMEALLKDDARKTAYEEAKQRFQSPTLADEMDAKIESIPRYVPAKNETTFTVNVALRSGGEQDISADKLKVTGIQASDNDRPPTKFGYEQGNPGKQRSHTVAWSLTMSALKSAKGTYAQVYEKFYWKVADIYEQDSDGNQYARDVIQKSGVAEWKSPEEILKTPRPVSEWHSLLTTLIQTYVEAHQASQMASYSAEPKSNGEPEALKQLAKWEADLKADPHKPATPIQIQSLASHARKLLDIPLQARLELHADNLKWAANTWYSHLEEAYPNVVARFGDAIKATVT